jgi:hypothetical protein
MFRRWVRRSSLALHLLSSLRSALSSTTRAKSSTLERVPASGGSRWSGRSVAPLLCIDAQIADWPVSIRGFVHAVDLLSVKPLEDYASTSEMLKATIVGEFFECLRRLPTLLSAPGSCLSRSPSDKKAQASILARIVSGWERQNVPPRMDWGMKHSFVLIAR